MSHTCTHCGEPVERTEEHHVDEQRGNNNPDNLTDRCPRCHHNGTHDNPRRTDSLTTEKYGPRTPNTGPP
jgi:endogenous inhibitor of DNA gyrase (YacG/DUF329 family)